MTQVSNTKTVFIPPNYLHEEHKNDGTHSGYIPFDHKLLLREDIRVPVTGQTTLNLSSISATPNLTDLRWQTFDILDDEFIVDLILPYYSVTPYPHGEASAKPYAPFKVRAGTANFSEPRMDRLDDTCYRFLFEEDGVDDTGKPKFKAVRDETATRNFPEDPETQLPYSLFTLEGEPGFDTVARRRFFSQFLGKGHHSRWLQQQAENTIPPGEPNSPFIKVRVAIKGGVYDPFRGADIFRTAGERYMSVQNGPYGALSNLEAIKAPTAPTHWGEPFDEQDNTLGGRQYLQAGGKGEFCERLTDAILTALHNQVGETLWNPTEEQSTQNLQYGARISVWGGRDSEGNELPNRQWAPCYKTEYDFFYKRLLFEVLKSVRVQVVPDTNQVQIQIHHGAMMADLMAAPRYTGQLHQNMDSGVLSDVHLWYQQSPRDVGEGAIAPVGEDSEEATFKVGCIPLFLPFTYVNAWNGSLGYDPLTGDKQIEKKTALAIVTPKSNDVDEEVLLGVQETNQLSQYSYRDTAGIYQSCTVNSTNGVLVGGMMNRWQGVERTMNMRTTLNMFCHATIQSKSVWGSKMLGQSQVGQTLKGQCCPIVTDRLTLQDDSFDNWIWGVNLEKKGRSYEVVHFNHSFSTLASGSGALANGVDPTSTPLVVEGAQALYKQMTPSNDHTFLPICNLMELGYNPYFTARIDPMNQSVEYPFTLPSEMSWDGYLGKYGYMHETILEESPYQAYGITSGLVNGHYRQSDHDGFLLVNGYQPTHLMAGEREYMWEKCYNHIMGNGHDVNRMLYDTIPKEVLSTTYEQFKTAHVQKLSARKRKDNGQFVTRTQPFYNPSPWRLGELINAALFVFVDVGSSSSNTTITTRPVEDQNDFTNHLSLMAVFDSSFNKVYSVNVGLTAGSQMNNLRIVIKNAQGETIHLRGEIALYLSMETRTDLTPALV
eukprot:CFRG8240T1